MKTLTLLLSLFVTLPALAHDHTVKHQMVLFGSSEIFASHIVYRVPHNYQAILKVNLPDEVRTKIAVARALAPKDLLLLIFDPTDISDIGTPKDLSGIIVTENEAGDRSEVATGVQIAKEEYEVVFFSEVLTDLTATPHH